VLLLLFKFGTGLTQDDVLPFLLQSGLTQGVLDRVLGHFVVLVGGVARSDLLLEDRPSGA